MKYIVDFKPHREDILNNDYYAEIERKISEGKSISKEESQNLLRVINFLTRQKVSLDFNNFENTCDLAQSILGHYLESINCKATHCSTQSTITPKVMGHNFSIVTLNVEGAETDYLLDPTYIQFFTEETCSFDNYRVSETNPNLVLLTPSPGYFIKNEEKTMANFLLKYGYIELTPETAKMYGDSFYNTDRGLKLSPTEPKSLPGMMYLKSFKTGNEQLSTTKDKLVTSGLAITSFYEKQTSIKKVI